MAIEVKLPSLGEGIDAGDVLEVLVSEGDMIEKEQPIVELETDKATVEVPSSHAGKVTQVHVATGQSVSIGATLLTIEASDAAIAEPKPAPAAAPEVPAATTQTSSPPAVENPDPTPPQKVVTPAQTRTNVGNPDPTPVSATAPVASNAAPALATGNAASAPAGPANRRLAREVGVDITTVVGTGTGGRITRDDILSVVRKGPQADRQTQSASTSAPVAPPEETSPTSAAGSTSDPASSLADADAWGPIDVEPMPKIRKTIANKMHESWESVPRVTNFDDADVTELEEIRRASKADYAARGIKLTQMPFLIKAVAMSLKTNPSVNASIDEVNQQIIYKKYVNIGIAVDSDRGLVVPSLRKADQQSIPEIARALGTLADNVRNNNFKLDDLRGSTFTISNLGAIGGTYSTPIVNVPEVAILLVGRTRKMPVVVDDEVKVRSMMPLSISYDHRLVDGATAARFLNDIIAYLESPSRLLIAP